MEQPPEGDEVAVDDAVEGETEGGEELEADTGEGHAGVGVGVGVVECVREEQRRFKNIKP